MTHQLVRPRLWSNMKRLMEVRVVLLESRSKICQKVVKKSRNHQRVQRLQGSEKFAKAIGLEEHLAKHQFSVKELELLLEL